MLHEEWRASLQEIVSQVRPFVQVEQQKRLARMQISKQVVNEKLTIADYITNFQIDSPNFYNGPYGGDVNVIDHFFESWQQKVKELQMDEQSIDVSTAVEFMTDDLAEITELMKELHPEDDDFATNVKRFCEECISKVVIAIRDGWSTAPTVYGELLQVVQDFLSELGVSTLPIKVGDQVNYDFVEPVESTQNITTNPDEDETIKEIQLYPYVYGNEQWPFITGNAIVWRKG